MRHRMESRLTFKRGFTLLEGIFSMFITFLVLGSLVYTLQQAGAVKANTKNLDKLSESFHSLMLIKSDLRASLEVVNTSGSSNQLELIRISPDKSFLTRIGPDADLNPFKVEDRERVFYGLENGILRRKVTQSDASSTSERLIVATDFNVETSTNPPFVEISIGVENTRMKKTHTMKVALR